MIHAMINRYRHLFARQLPSVTSDLISNCQKNARNGEAGRAERDACVPLVFRCLKKWEVGRFRENDDANKAGDSAVCAVKSTYEVMLEESSREDVPAAAVQFEFASLSKKLLR